jgi:ribulose-phosphate 3-epimerase
LSRIDLLLVMSVHPGFGGQEFMAEVIPKVARAAERARRDDLPLTIEVDGGIDVDTVGRMAEAGADTFVAGSAIFGHPEPAAAARAIRDAAAAAVTVS